MRTSAGLSVESIEEAREVFTEEMELQEEISDALLEPLSTDQAGDEELLSELNILMAADEIDVNQLLPDLNSMSLSKVKKVPNHNAEVEADSFKKTADICK